MFTIIKRLCASSVFILYSLLYSPGKRQNQIVEYIVHNGMMKDLSVLQEAPFNAMGSVVEKASVGNRHRGPANHFHEL